MSYAIFRVQGIKTLSDLRGLGKHNAERVSETNLDIDKERSRENIELIECDSYLQKFNDITVEMKEEHNERMRTVRKDRIKSFESAINSAHNDVACEFLFSSDEEFFKGMSKEQVESWARDSLEFVAKDIGITKDKIIHASVHMDEKTPHLHVVAVPVVKAYDGRRKQEVLQINRKQFIKTREDLSKLQDTYHQRMNEKGYKLERGDTKNARHERVLEFKEKTNYHEQELKKAKEQSKGMISKVVSLQNTEADLNLAIYSKELDLEQLKKSTKKVKALDDIEFKEKRGLLRSKTIELAPEDFQQLKALAQSSESFKRKNESLEGENNRLRNENASLRVQNKDLKDNIRQVEKEKDSYKSHFERLQLLFNKVRDFYREQDKVKKFDCIVGIAKCKVNQIIGRVNSRMRYSKDDMTESEKEGYQYQANIVKENRLKQRKKEREQGPER
ncbi:MobV family relaxase [Priestia endophytica]|uniref:MobV family relaxase n=1 Tax=Priestia endophytica TaxID=135735 RepID=UPI001559E179|nr:MobV family relaxase [Priestia endophytica]